jgi:hypothetical protein
MSPKLHETGAGAVERRLRRRLEPRRSRRILSLSLAATLCAAASAAEGEGPAGPPEEGGTTVEAPSGQEPVDDERAPDEIGRPLEKPPSLLEELLAAVRGGEVHANLRLRGELVDQESLGFAEAYTSRLRLGYGTRPWRGASAYVEFEDVRAADLDLYNAAGLNDRPDLAVVADPPVTELNQLFLRLEPEPVPLEVTAGRQRITLDDQRFVGNVGWRQNEQTFDALAARSSLGIEGLAAFYAYVWRVNRIFGSRAGRDFDSESHFIHARYTCCPELSASVFAYLLDFRNSPALSSNSFGCRLSGERALGQRFSAAYAASYAYQTDAASNPADYEASYYAIEASAGEKRFRSGAGYEVLGSGEGTAAFQTPLATLHAFNGWADVFLTTPAGGLRDLYVFADLSLPFEVRGRTAFHWFFADAGGSRLGSELDLLASRKLGKHVTLLAKYALFDGRAGLADVQKIWFQLELEF